MKTITFRALTINKLYTGFSISIVPADALAAFADRASAGMMCIYSYLTTCLNGHAPQIIGCQVQRHRTSVWMTVMTLSTVSTFWLHMASVVVSFLHAF